MNPIVLDQPPRPVEELVSFNAPSSLEADQYRMLRHAVERMHQDAVHRVFGITSAAAGDGKSVTTLNLAGSLAQSRGSRVLIICADLHRETVPQYLGINAAGRPGLADAITRDDWQLSQVTHRLEAFNVAIVTGGNVQLRPYELLSSRRLQALLDEARRDYDYVLIDTPPVAPLADCRLLGRWVDGFILVVAANKTPRKLLAEALRVLEPAQLLGVVFNGDDSPLSPYYGYYARPSIHGGQ
jgi:protein-tyrosine kinase